MVELIRQISTYLQGKECEVYPAPFDVRLSEPNVEDEAVYNVVQPDISIICDPAKLFSDLTISLAAAFEQE